MKIHSYTPTPFFHSVEDQKMGSENPQILSPQDYYHLIRAHLDSENQVLSQKLNWLVGSQAFLFIAYISLLNSPLEPRLLFFKSQLELFLWLTPMTAFLISILTYVSMLGSYAYLKLLRNQYEKYQKNELVRTFPPIQGDRRLRILSEISMKLLPIPLIFTWFCTLLTQFLKM